jgi:hypothetical protein
MGELLMFNPFFAYWSFLSLWVAQHAHLMAALYGRRPH